MKNKQYSDEFKELIIKECQETGNVALVARRHEMSPNTIHTWLMKNRKNGSVKALPKAKKQREKAMEKRLKEVSTENDRLKRLLADKELELAILRELRDIQNPPVADRFIIAKRWIDKGYNASLVLDSVGLSPSTYYQRVKGIKPYTDNQGLRKRTPGRKIPGYSVNVKGKAVPDAIIKENIKEIVTGDGFPYGYKKINVTLKEDYQLIINHKKTYRLCKELNILRPQRKIYPYRPRKLAKREKITAPNQQWQMDIKYGYIEGMARFFFQLSLIDVYDRSVIDYHLGLSATARDACAVLINSLKKRGLKPGMDLPVIRTDNGPQFIAKVFEKTCSKWKLTHERIPVKTPNMNAYIESFHSILEDECYSRNEFTSFTDAYKVISEYMAYYNNRRRHGSIGYMAPAKYYEAVKNSQIARGKMIA
ncbi:MAG: IS3 family transposase [Bacillota bacterium]